MTLEEIDKTYTVFDADAEKIRERYRLDNPLTQYFNLARNGKYPDFYITFHFTHKVQLPEDAKKDFADLFVKHFRDSRSSGINFSEVV